MAVRILLSVKEAWIIADSLREKRDWLRGIVHDGEKGPETYDCAQYVRIDLEAIEATMAKLLSPDSWTD
jgi:hypothetical protein